MPTPFVTITAPSTTTTTTTTAAAAFLSVSLGRQGGTAPGGGGGGWGHSGGRFLHPLKLLARQELLHAGGAILGLFGRRHGARSTRQAGRGPAAHVWAKGGRGWAALRLLLLLLVVVVVMVMAMRVVLLLAVVWVALVRCAARVRG